MAASEPITLMYESRRGPTANSGSGVQAIMPFWNRAVFIDWHGVLSSRPFWYSLRDARLKHTVGSSVLRESRSLFGDNHLVRAWMKGHVDSDTIVSRMRLESDARVGDDFALRRLFDDCYRMPIDPAVIDLARYARQVAQVAIATDNMDCFYAGAVRRIDLTKEFDGILCSSELGVLKAEDTSRFFGGWLAARGLQFAEAVLIDDDAGNCAAFRARGGSAIHFSGPNAVGTARRALEGFLHPLEAT